MESIYEASGLRRVVNACGHMTALGVSIISDEVAEAVKQAGQNFVVIDELIDRVGEMLTAVTGAEDTCVTNSASGGIMIATAACIAGIAAVGELVDDRILAALGAANGTFLVPTTGGLLGSGLVDHPLEAVCRRVGLVAALALMPVVGAVILPLCTVAVGMSAACCRDRCSFKNLLADGAFLMAHSSTRKGK